MNLLLGLFSPARYGIEKYNDLNIGRLKDNYRELSIILNRDGISNASIDLTFFGACNFFSEVPRIPTEQFYERVATFQ